MVSVPEAGAAWPDGAGWRLRGKRPELGVGQKRGPWLRKRTRREEDTCQGAAPQDPRFVRCAAPGGCSLPDLRTQQESDTDTKAGPICRSAAEDVITVTIMENSQCASR